jgi:hypothetical protein
VYTLEYKTSFVCNTASLLFTAQAIPGSQTLVVLIQTWFAATTLSLESYCLLRVEHEHGFYVTPKNNGRWTQFGWNRKPSCGPPRPNQSWTPSLDITLRRNSANTIHTFIRPLYLCHCLELSKRLDIFRSLLLSWRHFFIVAPLLTVLCSHYSHGNKHNYFTFLRNKTVLCGVTE